MRWVGHVARMGEIRNVYNIKVGKPERKGPVWKDEKVILKWILKKFADVD
jgi:hypothetical protein